MRTLSALLVMSLALVACSDAPLDVSLLDLEGDVVRFSVRNPTDLDVRSARFIVQYEVESGRGLRADTVGFAITRDASGEIPFVEAGEGTFFPHELPEGASNPTARLLSVEYWDGTSWGEG